MITEDYVSFEVAKLLNIKGFKGEFHKHYWGYEPGKEFLTDGSFNPEYDYPAPTLQMANKWLRDRYKLCVVVEPYTYITEKDIFYLFEIMEMNKDSVLNIKAKTGFDTYEEAVEAAIKYCLENLI